MNYTVRFAPEAQHQLDAIEDFIAHASGFFTRATHFVDGIVAYCESFQTFPDRGARRDDLLSGLRIVGYRKSVTVAFRVDTSSRVVSIMGIFYGGQDYEAALAWETSEKGDGGD